MKKHCAQAVGLPLKCVSRPWFALAALLSAACLNASANVAPVAIGTNITVRPTQTVVLYLTNFVFDADVGQTNTFRMVTNATIGRTILSGRYIYYYAPTSIIAQTDMFAWVVNDGYVDSNVATCNVQVVTNNNPPIAVSAMTTCNAAGAKAISLPTVHPDVEQKPLYRIVRPPSIGSIYYQTNQYAYYRAPAGVESVTDTFEWACNDGFLDSNVATQTVVIGTNRLPIVSNQVMNVLSGVPMDLMFYCNDPDGQTISYRVISGPSHGTVTTNVSGGNRITYRSDDGFTGSDFFQWIANDGFVDSSTATVTVHIAANAPMVVSNMMTWCLANRARDMIPILADADMYFSSTVNPSGQTYYAASLVRPPSHGNLIVTNQVRSPLTLPKLIYTPDTNFTGLDSFEYTITDGGTVTPTLKCEILVRSDNDNAGMLVLVLAEETLLSKIQPEVDRLQQDLENEGYSARLVSWSKNTTGKAVWEYIRNQYFNSGKFLQGAILIGDIPYSGLDEYVFMTIGEYSTCPSDAGFWNMAAYETGCYGTRRDIWVSRIQAPAILRETYASEVDLAKRALQANHDYRTGASRLPRTATVFEETEDIAYHNTIPNWNIRSVIVSNFENSASYTWLRTWRDNLTNCWTPSHIWPINDAMIEGGEFAGKRGWHPSAHEVWRNSPYYVTPERIMNEGSQLRAYDFYAFGPSGNNKEPNCCLFARNTRAVIGIWPGFLGQHIGYSSASVPFIKLLGSGDNWGSAAVLADPIKYSGGLQHLGVGWFGDLSLRANMTPPNQMPVLDNLIVSTNSGKAPLTVTFTATAHDPDGSVVRYEWYPLGYDYGRIEPAQSGPANTFTYTFTSPRKVKARVVAFDNYKAWVFKEIEITVAPDPAKPIRVNCGPVTGTADYTDANGNVWFCDQSFVAGSWGCNVTWDGLSYRPDYVVENTADQYLFSRFKVLNYSDTYKFTLPNGGYTVRVGLADMVSTNSGMRLLDIKVEDQTWLTAYDVYAQAGGAQKAIFVSTHTTVTNGVLDIFLGKNAVSSNAPMVSCLEVIPDFGGNQAPVARNGVLVVEKGGTRSAELEAADEEGDALTFALVTDAGHGHVVVSGNQAIYTADNGYSGPDQFTFTASDGSLTSQPGTVTVTVASTTNTATIYMTCDDEFEAYCNGVRLGKGYDWHQSRQWNVPLADGKNVIAVRCSDFGEFADHWGDVYRYAGLLAEISFSGTRIGSSFLWKASKFERAGWQDPGFDDSEWANATESGKAGVAWPWTTYVTGWPSGSPASWIWSSDNKNDPEVWLRFTFYYHPAANAVPVAQGQSVTTKPCLARVITLTGIDADGDPLSYSIASQPMKGTLSGTLPNVVYTPNAGYSGADSFMFKVCDGLVTSAAATVSITITDPDPNENGIPDTWEIQYFGSNHNPDGDASADADGDGATNWQEYRAGTDPMNVGSVFKVSEVTPPAVDGALTMRWFSVAGRTYRIERCANLVDGFSQAIAAGITATPPVNTLSLDAGTTDGGFFRVVVE